MKGFFFSLLKWAHRNTKSRQTLTKDRQQATKGPSNYCFFKKKKVGRLSHHQPTSGIDNLLLLLLPVLIVLHAPLVSVRVKKSDHKSAECAFWVSSNNQSTTQLCVCCGRRSEVKWCLECETDSRDVVKEYLSRTRGQRKGSFRTNLSSWVCKLLHPTQIIVEDSWHKRLPHCPCNYIEVYVLNCDLKCLFSFLFIFSTWH